MNFAFVHEFGVLVEVMMMFLLDLEKEFFLKIRQIKMFSLSIPPGNEIK
jgi:hypothetical protein